MNWLDFVFIAILVVGALIGMRLRLIGALFIAVGVLIGWLLAGQWSDDIGNIFADSLSNDTLVTVVSYAVIIVGVVIASNFAKKIFRRTANYPNIIQNQGEVPIRYSFRETIKKKLSIFLKKY